MAARRTAAIITSALPDIGDDSALDRAPHISAIPSIPALGEASSQTGLASVFHGLVDAAKGTSDALDKAQQAENAFMAGTGDAATMMFERTRADELLQVAAATSTHVSQSLNQILNMQV